MFSGKLARPSLAIGFLAVTAAFAQAPALVPGKEYADVPNKNAANVATPGQSLLWNGAGAVIDGFNYSPIGASPREVDALAHRNDALFDSVIRDLSAMLITFSGNNNIFFENVGGATGIWATPAMINAGGVNEIDGLEVWGPEGVVDGDRYSELGDPSGCAVLRVGGVCMATVADIAGSINVDVISFDLDGLMTFEANTDFDLDPADPLFNSHGGKAPNILFSIRPTANRAGMMLDGGEIWTYDTVTKTSAFLFHGGHLWDTAFDVMGTFGVTSENVIGIEAINVGSNVPEPGTMGLLAAGVALVAISRFRR
jgi:hypothetical protein